MSVHVLQTLVLYECEKHAREEEWEEAHVGDRISGILMQLISCLQVSQIDKASIFLPHFPKSLIKTFQLRLKYRNYGERKLFDLILINDDIRFY